MTFKALENQAVSRFSPVKLIELVHRFLSFGEVMAKYISTLAPESRLVKQRAAAVSGALGFDSGLEGLAVVLLGATAGKFLTGAAL